MIRAILTMDDAPSKNTSEIAAYLHEKGIQAILFAVGQDVEKHFDQAVCALKHGMIVGNHSFSHPAFSRLSLTECMEEIGRCERALSRLYRAAGVERKAKVFRFPYGDKGGENKTALQQFLRTNGFQKAKDAQIADPWWRAYGLDRDVDTFWTYDFEEYRVRPGSAFTKENVMEKTRDLNPSIGAPLLKQNGRHILLMHDHDETEAMWPGYVQQLIDHALENGVVFENPEFMDG